MIIRKYDRLYAFKSFIKCRTRKKLKNLDNAIDRCLTFRPYIIDKVNARFDLLNTERC